MLLGIFARAVLKMNFIDLSGLLAGSMTDPPALAFASNIAGSDAPTIAYATVFSATGLQWLLAGACVTVLPLMLIGVFARVVLKMNFMDLSGLLAGSMTDPPALQFAGTVTQSDSPSIAYAAVYPLVMLLRVLAAQILVLVFV